MRSIRLASGYEQGWMHPFTTRQDANTLKRQKDFAGSFYFDGKLRYLKRD